jgi:hypothetical protein
MGKILKKQDWVSRLASFVSESENSKFKYGRIDCALFICDAIEAMTGVDVGEDYRDRYKSKREAYKIIEEKGSLCALGESVFALFFYDDLETFGFIAPSGRDVCVISKSGVSILKRNEIEILKAWSLE